MRYVFPATLAQDEEGRWLASFPDVPVYVPPLVAAKLALYQAMREQGVSNTEFAKRLGVTEAVVRRLVNPDHSSKIEKVQAALLVLGKHLVVEAA